MTAEELITVCCVDIIKEQHEGLSTAHAHKIDGKWTKYRLTYDETRSMMATIQEISSTWSGGND